MTGMNRNVDASLDPDAHESQSFDRRKLVVGAAGAVVAAALGASARAARFSAPAGTVARAQFDPALAHRLQQVLDEVIASSGGKPGTSSKASAPWAGQTRHAPSCARRESRAVDATRRRATS
jgi:hypothetical protein